jgi:hypothetical protein
MGKAPLDMGEKSAGTGYNGFIIYNIPFNKLSKKSTSALRLARGGRLYRGL